LDEVFSTKLTEVKSPKGIILSKSKKSNTRSKSLAWVTQIYKKTDGVERTV